MCGVCVCLGFIADQPTEYDANNTSLCVFADLAAIFIFFSTSHMHVYALCKPAAANDCAIHALRRMRSGQASDET